MNLFIQIDEVSASRAQGPYVTIDDGEKAFDRACRKKTTSSAKLWNTDAEGNAVGAPIMSFEKEAT